MLKHIGVFPDELILKPRQPTNLVAQFTIDIDRDITMKETIHGVVGQQDQASDTRPCVPYWHVWTDDDGVSRQTRCTMTDFISKSISPPAAPQWQDHLSMDNAVVLITVQPAGWLGTWHENPKPQWIIPLTGRWFVETMDGQRVEMGPGEISFGEDQGTKTDEKGRKGHLSGTVGDEPVALMIVQLQSPPQLMSPCRFK